VCNGRPIIVVKQGGRAGARWLFDLLHELEHIVKHAKTGKLSSDFEVIETHPITPERRNSPEEEEANEFAEDILFHGRSRVIEQACVSVADGNIRNLKATISEVAAKERIDVGILANHMAYRLSQQGQNWWSTAMTLQRSNTDPFLTARDRLLREARLKALNPIDRDLLLRACSDLDQRKDNLDG
jgi:hypothetical protein